MGILWSTTETDRYALTVELCDNCEMSLNQNPQEGIEYHRCRAYPDSCVEGTDCPDYVKECSCPVCQNNFAIVRWSIDDVQGLRKDCSLTEWTQAEARDFLLRNEGRIQDRLVELGWEVLWDLMMDEGEE